VLDAPKAQECRGDAEGTWKKNRAAKKKDPPGRQPGEAGFFNASPRSFWMICGIARGRGGGRRDQTLRNRW